MSTVTDCVDLLGAYTAYAIALCAEHPNTADIAAKKTALLAQCTSEQTPATVGQLVWSAYRGTTIRRGNDRDSLIATMTDAAQKLMLRQPNIIDDATAPRNADRHSFQSYIGRVRASLADAIPA